LIQAQTGLEELIYFVENAAPPVQPVSSPYGDDHALSRAEVYALRIAAMYALSIAEVYALSIADVYTLSRAVSL